MTTLERDRSLVLLVDVQERINGVMADQGHVPRLEVLLAAAEVLHIPVVTTEQYPKGLGPTLSSLQSVSPESGAREGHLFVRPGPADSGGTERERTVTDRCHRH